ncbi:SDR family NAD(P)-dependent oxidoreductase [Priestia megaterium]|uniref:SDR family NAD(P)-dependent oxidoreductase n=1 Tax=Priestia megaterium TaxID=1404 RepID=UPI003A7F875A
MRFAIVTGVSKGLGYDISKVLTELNIDVIGLSRSTNETVENLIKSSNGQFTHIPMDLINVDEIESLIKEVCHQILARKPQKVYVFNNASMIEPIERLGYLDNNLIQQAINLNLVAPLFINNSLLKILRNEDIELVIVNITSSAAERPIYGWNIYNGTKAAINMHTKVAGLEQESINASHKIVGFNPGLMDTDMQGTIRGADQDAFTEIDKFLNFKKNGDLRPSRDVAKALMDIILSENLINGKIYSINEIL